jgi:3-methyladenine DNA glycosylase AlkC
MLKVPEAPYSIEKGIPLKEVLGKTAIAQLAANLHFVYPDFNTNGFIKNAMTDIEPLSITQRGKHIAEAMRKYLPENYSEAIQIILKSLTPPLEKTDGNGLATMFYMPHCSYIAKYGLDPKLNGAKDPFDISMEAQYEITQRFTCEFSIRPFIIEQQDRTMEVLYRWMNDENPHVRRLCSEGTRSRLPWAGRIPAFINDPKPVLPILEQLKNDPDLYVRRSVANHIGDIAKDHIDLAFDICEQWTKGASKELKWVIRHAVRHPAKKGNPRALKIREAAK